MTRLSHSACSKYQDCSKAYEYHYIKKYRSTTQSAALLFGTAIDKACEKYALTNSLAEALTTFENSWDEQELNGKATKLIYCTEIVYSNNDFDIDLLDQSDYDFLTKTYGVEDVQSTIQELYKKKEVIGFDNLTQDNKELLNVYNWMCLRHKGQYMVAEFASIFQKNVEEVLGTQVEVSLENEQGDSIIGYVDFVLKMKNEEVPVIIDLKTAGRAYDDDSVTTSPQLGLYVYSLKHKYQNTNRAGYIVLNKNIKKNKDKVCSICGYDGSGARHKTCNNENIEGVRCNGAWNEKINPSVNYQIIIDTVPELLQERIVENFNEVNKGIKAQIFPRNFSACKKYNGAVICPFYHLCHHNKMDNIVDKSKEE
jgi:hypothetical protein